MRFAFADPPYPGRAYLYSDVDMPDAEEVDHAELVERLMADYPDGWALSTDERGLWTVLPLLAAHRRRLRARVAVWHRTDAMPFGVGHPRGRDARIGYGYELVVIAGGRGRGPSTMDVLATAGRVGAARFLGAKPPTYAAWVLRLLGAQPGDQVDDLYPGSGSFRRAADEYLAQMALWPPRPRHPHARRNGKLRSSRGRTPAQPVLWPILGEAAG